MQAGQMFSVARGAETASGGSCHPNPPQSPVFEAFLLAPDTLISAQHVP